MDATMTKTKQPFVPPTCEIILFQTADIITASGGFEGEWDENIPEM